MNGKAEYKRIILKISGEALRGSSNSIYDEAIIKEVAQRILKLTQMGVQIGLVVGGGNIWRGRNNSAMTQVTSDSIGMLSTVLNALALKDFLIDSGCRAEVLSSVEMHKFCDYYTTRKAEELLQSGTVVIFACGIGNPFLSTDTTAAMRGAELNADVILLSKQGVDGVYDKDPLQYSDAKKYTELTYKDIIEKNLKVMDSTAASLCISTSIPILVFGMDDMDNIIRIVEGEKIGTMIKEGN